MPSFTEDDIRKIWESDWSEAFKRFFTAGIVITAAKQNRLHCVLVGGAAVEFYGHANYATSDIDIVTVDDVSERETMESLGFHRYAGRHWEIDGLPVAIEFPPSPLAGDLKRVVSEPFCINDVTCNVDVISLEDLIVDRCGNWTVNNRPHSNTLENPNSLFEDLDDVIYYLMDTYDDKLDWPYLMAQAKAQSDECYKVAKHFKGYFKHIQGEVSPKNPKRQMVFESDEYKDYLKQILDYQGHGKRYADVFMSLAKPILMRDGLVWSERSDNEVFSKLIERIKKPYDYRHVMLSSPYCYGLNNHGKATYVSYFIKKFQWDTRLKSMERNGGRK